ncbi:uncharacterized protein VTP21DRAFT_6254 [Calcarisporiella thermophila]|uniref:uncharacterized protein n=1 Tax=Calcarisporiella thermophila TaxID=911321 RepID=UPI0037429D02
MVPTIGPRRRRSVSQKDRNMSTHKIHEYMINNRGLILHEWMMMAMMSQLRGPNLAPRSIPKKDKHNNTTQVKRR